jgi:hypothetical protein
MPTGGRKKLVSVLPARRRYERKRRRGTRAGRSSRLARAKQSGSRGESRTECRCPDSEAVPWNEGSQVWRRELQEQAESRNDLCQIGLCRGDSGPAADRECARGADCQRMTVTDSRLANLVEAWPSLPEHVILAILALVDFLPSSGGRSPPTPVLRIQMAPTVTG